ncbi:MAG: choice-of-anchor tandem repeat NxxGxxAF-containing protein [Phycisphaerales bacterium]
MQFVDALIRLRTLCSVDCPCLQSARTVFRTSDSLVGPVKGERRPPAPLPPERFPRKRYLFLFYRDHDRRHTRTFQNQVTSCARAEGEFNKTDDSASMSLLCRSTPPSCVFPGLTRIALSGRGCPAHSAKPPQTSQNPPQAGQGLLKIRVTQTGYRSLDHRGSSFLSPRRGWSILMKSLVFWGVAPAVLAAVCGGAASVQADEYRVVARAGLPASGTPLSGSNFYRLCSYAGSEAPVISGSGRIVFKAELLGGGLTALNNAAVFCSDASGPTSESLRVLAQTGAPYGGSSSGVRLASYSGLQASNNGRVGFQGLLTGTGVTSSTSKTYWSFDGGDVSLVAREGTAVSGSSIGSVTDIRVEGVAPEVEHSAPSGDMVTFKATVPGYTGVHTFYNFDSSGIHPLATVNSPAPGIIGASFSTNLRRVSGGDGYSLLYSTLTGTSVSSTNNSAIYLGSGRALSLAARTGQDNSTAYGTGLPGTSFTSLFATGALPVLNARGKGAFTASFSGLSSGTGVWKTWLQGGSPQRQLLLKTGDPASGPGLETGTTFSSFVHPGLTQNLLIGNDASDSIALVAGLAGPGIGQSNSRSLWIVQSPGSRQLVLRGGQDVGGGSTIVGDSIGSAVRMNSHGHLAIRAAVVTDPQTGATANAIFRYADGRLTMVAKEGQAIQGSSERFLRNVRWAPGLQFNDLGQIVFVGTVGLSSTDLTGQPALLRVDQAGGLAVIAMTGHRLTTTAGETVALGAAAYSDSASLSNSGDVTFVSTLTAGGTTDHALFRVSIEPLQAMTPPRNIADFNGSGVVSQQDLYDFLNSYFAGSSAADTDESASITVQDLFLFLHHYFAAL